MSQSDTHSQAPVSELVEKGEATREAERSSSLGYRTGETVPILVFRVGQVTVGCDAKIVDSIGEWNTPTPLPRVPRHVLGLVSQGDNAIPVVDLADFLSLDAKAAREVEGSRRVLFVVVNGMHVGLVCEKVIGVIEFAPEARQDSKVLQGTKLREFLTAEYESAQGLVGLLDMVALLTAAQPQ